jgi:sugar/nucleoside kinase (ribokinase family)
MLDPAPAAALNGEMLRKTAWFTPNATEGGFYTQRKTDEIAKEADVHARPERARAAKHSAEAGRVWRGRTYAGCRLWTPRAQAIP